MSKSLRLSEEAVRSSSYHLSDEALEALQRGDVGALIASHRDRFGGWKMEADDDPDDDDNDDDDTGDGDDDDDDDDDQDDDDADEDGPEGKKSKKAEKERDDNPEGLKRKIAALEDEKNRLYRGRDKARRERDELRTELEKVKKDGVTDDSVKTENAELTKSNETLTTRLQEAQLQIAFLSDSTYEWQNPGLALKAADLSDVEIDDDGTVSGLKSALEALATENPYLLKQPETKKRAAPKPGPTGKPAAKPKASKKTEAERAAIAAKYRIQR